MFLCFPSSGNQTSALDSVGSDLTAATTHTMRPAHASQVRPGRHHPTRAPRSEGDSSQIRLRSSPSDYTGGWSRWHMAKSFQRCEPECVPGHRCSGWDHGQRRYNSRPRLKTGRNCPQNSKWPPSCWVWVMARREFLVELHVTNSPKVQTCRGRQ